MERLIVEGRVEGRRLPKRWVDQEQNTWWAIICRMRYTWHRIELPGKRQSRELIHDVTKLSRWQRNFSPKLLFTSSGQPTKWLKRDVLLSINSKEKGSNKSDQFSVW